MVSPCPPSTMALTSSTETSVASAMKVRNRAESSTPAMPITRSRGKSAAANATWHMASRGFETTMRMASGDCWTACSVTERTMPMLVRSKSSRLMPGLRAMPEVMTTTSDPAVSSYPLLPVM